jgi:hypothetical protein
MMFDHRFVSYSRFIGTKKDHDTYAWCVYLDVDRDKLNDIQEVEYVLHPTFPNPVRVIRSAKHCFALESEGWGGFLLHMRIILNNGDIVRDRYNLNFVKDGWPMGKRLTTFDDESTELVYNTLLREKWDWRKLSTLTRSGNVDPDTAKSILERLENRRAVRKAHFASIDNEELWGATCRIGLLPEPK